MKKLIIRMLSILCLSLLPCMLYAQTTAPVFWETTTPEQFYEIGVARLHGITDGTEQNIPQARYALEQACRGEYAKASFMIAEMYASGVYTHQNYEAAISWYELAAEQ